VALQVFLSESFHPHLNIGTEEWIFDHLDPGQQVLFLWRNEPTVVIGRTQNPWSECNLARMKEDGVHLARRRSGGGAVFHDLGNTNFTFLSPKDAYKRENNLAVIFAALETLGVRAEASGRNDLLVNFADGPRKFSGSAYREKRDRAFHHGTLLLDCDLSRLGNYLTPNPKKMKAKGKESVRARVANLSEVVPGISHERIVPALVSAFEGFYGEKARLDSISRESLRQNPALASLHAELASWDWLYGKTQGFTHQMDEYLSLGLFEFQFSVEEGRIRDVRIHSDSLYPALILQLEEAFRAQPYQGDTVGAALAQAHRSFPEISAGLTELESWLRARIEA
jgi:lipoate-protein ligase A